MLVNDCVLDLKSQEGSIPGTGIDPSLSLWLHKVATCVPQGTSNARLVTHLACEYAGEA